MRNTAWADKVTYLRMKCFHEKIHIFGQNKTFFTAKCFHIIFWFGDLIYVQEQYSSVRYVLEYDKIRPTKLILEIMKNAAQVKCGLGRFLK